jgi:hypothetical protein
MTQWLVDSSVTHWDFATHLSHLTDSSVTHGNWKYVEKRRLECRLASVSLDAEYLERLPPQPISTAAPPDTML